MKRGIETTLSLDFHLEDSEVTSQQKGAMALQQGLVPPLSGVGGKEWNGVYLVFANPVSTVHHGRGLYWNSILHCLILSNCREFRVLMAVLIEVQILKG